MKKRVVLVASLGAFAFTLACSGGGLSLSTPTQLQATSTAPLPRAISINDALLLLHPGALMLDTVTAPQTVTYVDTTVGQARTLFEPNRPGGWSVPDDAPAWAIVAYGQWTAGHTVITNPSPGTITTIWWVVVKGTSVPVAGYGNNRYDLSQLGTPAEAPWPK